MESLALKPRRGRSLSKTHALMRLSELAIVVLPRRTIHIGVWFRLMRTVIEELAIPLSKLRVGPRRTIELIWRRAGHPVRGGIVGAARTYETLPWWQQEMYLEAAATAVQMVETEEIAANGTLGHLLTPEPDRIVGNGTPPRDRGNEERDLWADAREALSEAVTLAQQDPLAAEHMLAILTISARTEKSFQSVRDDLIGLDIPEEVSASNACRLACTRERHPMGVT